MIKLYEKFTKVFAHKRYTTHFQIPFGNNLSCQNAKINCNSYSKKRN